MMKYQGREAKADAFIGKVSSITPSKSKIIDEYGDSELKEEETVKNKVGVNPNLIKSLGETRTRISNHFGVTFGSLYKSEIRKQL